MSARRAAELLPQSVVASSSSARILPGDYVSACAFPAGKEEEEEGAATARRPGMPAEPRRTGGGGRWAEWSHCPVSCGGAFTVRTFEVRELGAAGDIGIPW
jgi:hypothetical protein